MPVMNTTPNQGYQLPFAGNDLVEDVARLIFAIGQIDTDIASALSSLASKAGLAGPAFTGVPTAPTAAPGTDTGQLATTAFVKAAFDALIGGAPGALDTLNELAAALADDADFAATITASIALKADQATTYTKTEVDDKTTLADQAEAETGTDAAKLMTPLLTRQAAFAYNRWKTIGIYNPSAVSSFQVTDLDGYSSIRFAGFLLPSANATISFRVSGDNGSTWKSGASDYNHASHGALAGTASAAVFAATAGSLTMNTSGAGYPRQFEREIPSWSEVTEKASIGCEFGVSSASTLNQYFVGIRMANGCSIALNALQFYPSTGVFTGEVHLEAR